jgi:hypothetical protein
LIGAVALMPFREGEEVAGGVVPTDVVMLHPAGQVNAAIELEPAGLRK